VHKFLSGIFKHPLFSPLVIYPLFFLPDSCSVQNLLTPAAQPPPPFSAAGELFHLFIFYVPALALVLYFCFEHTPDIQLKQSRFASGADGIIPRLKFSGGVALCTLGLLSIGAFTAAAENLFAQAEHFPVVLMPALDGPGGLFAVAVMAASCVVAAYLEESFFRMLLYRGLLETGLQKAPALLTASLLFALCHAWQGLWGMSGAFLSGLFLAFLFDRHGSLNLVAPAHALYNIIVYLLPF
jgi:membrane protease YdiL (CAAX protease family)